MSESNGTSASGPLSKEALADASRFQFVTDKVDLPEIGGFLVLKTLSVKERDGLPDLVDKDGNPDVSIPKLAAIFATAVSDPDVTQEEAEAFLPGWPATALDKVIEKFGELVGVGEDEAAKAAGAFPDRG